MVQIYRRKWRRGILTSLLGYIRDSLVLLMPCRHLPGFLIKLLYGVEIQFAFLVHPRAYHDVFVSLPFLAPMKIFLRKQKAYRFLFSFPPFVLNKIQTEQRTNGFVIALTTMPEMMLAERKRAEKMLHRALVLVSKICKPSTVVGLGGWWPMVTQRGLSLHGAAESLGLIITNGHCGTLASIYMMVEKIATIGSIDLSNLSLAVIGVGKMGTNVAKAFNGKVKRMTLIDVNKGSLMKTKTLLESLGTKTKIEIFLFSEGAPPIREALDGHQIGICATSTFRNLLKLKDMPHGFIAIDDSRPEALPRDPRKERLIFEGGLLKIKGATIDYNYGFGEDDNVFGCLGEAFLVALDKQKNLKPTLGGVDFQNLFLFLTLSKNSGVTAGDFKSGETYISDAEIYAALVKRGFVKHAYEV